jgi:tetratricopeptide (TPR) repeat protein
MRPTASRRIVAASAAVVAALLPACGEGPTRAAGESAASTVAAQERSATKPQPGRAAELAPVRAALEVGQAASALAQLVAQGAGAARPEATLLGARAQALQGDHVAAVRAIEDARAAFPAVADVYATAAEIHAAAGRLGSAEDEIRRGLEAAGGSTPELERARGVLLLAREGAAEAGLERLLRARAADPGLPFCERALSQAHLLLGNRALARGDAAAAVTHGRSAVVHDPEEREARRLLADALAGAGDFDAALPLYDELLGGDDALRNTVALHYQRGATAALLQRERAQAIERYRRARELGLAADELGFGAQVLFEEAVAAVERGVAAYVAGDAAGARAAFERAVALDPQSPEAHNHLAVCLHKAGEHAGAAEHWRAVLELAQAEGLELPEPVHLNLAQALVAAGRVEEARAVLEEYLRRAPEGEWSERTRELAAGLGGK